MTLPDMTDNSLNTYSVECNVNRDKGNITYKAVTINNSHQHRPRTNNMNNFTIFHQNIRGLTHKTDELLLSLNNLNPNFLCITEHHLRSEEINLINLGQYALGAHYCRKHYRQGGASTYILKNTVYEAIDLNQFCKEKVFEICALKMKIKSAHLLIDPHQETFCTS